MNLQIEMISVFATDGSITPLRFRLENEEHCLETVTISQVVSVKPICFAGIDAIQYLCKAVVEEKEKLFEVRYTVKTHRWTLFRVVY
ncbi:MAG: hypothetical protein IJJ99_08095 [Oscillospiraceae bacterium]|nr:hypothetical protein [Oscillospiraceae bacterium]